MVLVLGDLMEKMKRIISLICVLLVFASGIGSTPVDSASKDIIISIDMSGSRKPISPYIYGVTYDTDFSDATVNAIIQSSIRMSTYNWENNNSNAGATFFHSSDDSLINSFNESLKSNPALVATELSKLANSRGVTYSVLTLSLLDYVASDANGPVDTDEKAPSDRWNQNQIHNPHNFSGLPDLTDKLVYTDEYLKYLVLTLGKSTSPTGISAYSLDTRPEKWDDVFSLIRTSPVSADELISRSILIAKAVKTADPLAEIIGPSISGFDAYENLENPEDWEKIKGGYYWFIDYYLSKMKEASDEEGSRLLDVFAIQYYTEAGSETCDNVLECKDYTHKDCNAARMQAVRTLWDSTYVENSSVGTTKQQYLPLLKTIKASVNTYYPGTKIALSEYNFGGGGHVSGAIAQAEALGTFASQGVYLANLNATEDNSFQMMAMNLFTNYDSNNSKFGNTLLTSSTSDVNISSAYASVDDKNDGTVKIILTNKSANSVTANVNLEQTDNLYLSADAFGIVANSNAISKLAGVKKISNNSFKYTLPPYSVVELIVKTEAEVPPVTSTTSQTSTEPITSSPETTSPTNETTITTVPSTSANTSSTTGDLASSEADSEASSAGRILWLVLGFAVVIGCGSVFYYFYAKKKK